MGKNEESRFTNKSIELNPGNALFQLYEKNPDELLGKEFENIERAVAFLGLLGCDRTSLNIESGQIIYTVDKNNTIILTKKLSDGKVILGGDLEEKGSEALLTVVNYLRAKNRVGLTNRGLSEINVMNLLNAKPSDEYVDQETIINDSNYQNELAFRGMLTRGTPSTLKILRNFYENRHLEKFLNSFDSMKISDISVEFIKLVSRFEAKEQRMVFKKIILSPEELLKFYENTEAMKAVEGLKSKTQGIIIEWLAKGAIENVTEKLLKNLSQFDDGPLLNLWMNKIKKGAVGGELFKSEAIVKASLWRGSILRYFIEKVDDESIEEFSFPLVAFIEQLSVPLQDEILDKISSQAVGDLIEDKHTLLTGIGRYNVDLQRAIINKLDDSSIKQVSFHKILALCNLDEFAQIIFYNDKVTGNAIEADDFEKINGLDYFKRANSIILKSIKARVKFDNNTGDLKT